MHSQRYNGLPTVSRKYSNRLDTNISHFSPALTSAESQTKGNTFPFTRTSIYDELPNGMMRYTAPAMSRSGSREAQTQASAHQRINNAPRPHMTARTRSASSPVINGHTRPAVVPELPNTPRAYNASPNGSQQGSMVNNTLKVKVHYSDDMFVIALPFDSGYQNLYDRVEKKIRICGYAAGGVNAFRIKYLDEDGDMITISSDEDVQMAYEMSHESGGVLTLYATPVTK